MRARGFQWRGPRTSALELRAWLNESAATVDIAPIEHAVRSGGDRAVLELTARFDATERTPTALRVSRDASRRALEALDPALREAMDRAAENIRAVASAQAAPPPRSVELAQGHRVDLREVAVGSVGIYAPGGRAAYPSTVLMCAIPARIAGVTRLALASPPGPAGEISALVLAAAELCQIEEVYAMGGAQAIFALAYGTETVAAVDLIVGPGNAWVQEAKRAVYGQVGIDSLAGPSELMLVAGEDTNIEWAALDLCAQAEHGPDSPLVVVSVEEAVLDAIADATESAAKARPGVANAQLALLRVPELSDAIDLANAFAPEHLELLDEGAASLAERVITAGCVFSGPRGATAFGDYAAGSNHVLPTAGAGRFSGPLGTATFRRPIANVSIPAAAAAALAPSVDALARAEGFPVHAESAMIRR